MERKTLKKSIDLEDPDNISKVIRHSIKAPAEPYTILEQDDEKNLLLFSSEGKEYICTFQFMEKWLMSPIKTKK